MMNDSLPGAASPLAEAGFSIIWLKKKSKAPVHEKWTEQDTLSPETLKSSYRQGYNMGVRLGEPSKIGKHYLHVVDMDVRDPSYGPTARKKVEYLLKCTIVDFQIVISGSGGDSRHFYFLTDRPFRSKKLWHTDEKITGKDGKQHWAAEIELFGTGKQVVLPPSIHPDTGKAYRWASMGFDADDLPLIESELLAEITGEGERIEYEDEGPLDLTDDEIKDYLDMLDFDTYCVDREGWIKVGMALHHQFDGSEDGLEIWNWFSKRAKKKFDPAVSKQQWQSFKGRNNPITFATIIKAANDYQRELSWRDMAEEFEEEDDTEIEMSKPRDKTEKPNPEKTETARDDQEDDDNKVPAHLLTVPGVLGLAVDHYNATSTNYQPQFAVQTALALGSVTLARHWKSEAENYTSLYLVNLGATGAGKEFNRKFLGKCLKEAGLEGLMGPSKYASEAGVISELAWKPRHVTVYDEFGRLLASTASKGNTNLRDAQTLLVSLYGLLGDSARPTAYSANGKSKDQIEAMRSMVIRRPAVTLLGLSTPETFYDALSQDDVANGFLNRLIVVNSREEERVEDTKRWKPVPRELREWLFFYGSNDDEDFIKSESSAEADDPEVVEFTSGAQELLREIAEEVILLKKRYRAYRLDGMFSRTRENAMRIALIVTKSQDLKRINEKSLQWAWDYVLFYAKETVRATQDMMGSSPIIRIAEHLAQVIEDTGEKGATLRDLQRKSADFKKLSQRDTDEVLYRLSTRHQIIAPKPEGKLGKGRPTSRFYHADFAPTK